MPFNSKLLVPVALGFSLVSVSAFVVYYVLKKDEEEDKPVRSSKVNIIEVEVPKSIVAALIGRNGSNIKQIEEKTGAMIHFKKRSEKDYDVCIIRGRSDATQIAETLVHDFIKQQPLIVESNISVPGWSVGRIIGTGGDTINKISHRSGARVKIERNCGDMTTLRQVSFRGTEEQISMAKKLIEECVEHERCRREVEQSKPARVSTPPSTPSPAAADSSEATTSAIEVYVSAVSSPSRFWVQFVGPQVVQLDKLVAHMTEYYGNKENKANHALEKVSIGQVVAAVFRHDGRWYRARVDDLRPNEFDATQQVADVFYLDYGDSEYVATHDLCELRADLLRLRFQAMECFLAEVKPSDKEEVKQASGVRKWHPQAIERFEELTQVARWKPLLSKTCTYKKSSLVGDREKEVPGIKLYDYTEVGSVDIGEALIAEGWAETSVTPRSSPPRFNNPQTPFGDLSNSRVLGMFGPSTRAASLPKNHKDEGQLKDIVDPLKDNITSRSLASGLESTDKIKSVSNFDLSYSGNNQDSPKINGSHDFISSEKQNLENDLLKANNSKEKANMNRIDSHHSNLEALGRQ